MLGKIAWKNIIHKPLNTALCICLLLFGVGIISVLLLIQHQLEHKFQRDLKNIDLVVGAKGSPLQLVLSAVYHLDAPTGNIKLWEAKKLMNSPVVEEAIPLAYGDSYRGYRILGTTTDYMNKYNATFKEGKAFSKTMEATVGADIAEKVGLKIGDTFLGTHGEVKEGHVHEDHPYKVVGILEKTNSVLDRLILSNVESVWQVHSHVEPKPIDTLHALELHIDHDHDHGDHDDHDHGDHDHGDHDHGEGIHDHNGHDHEDHDHSDHDHGHHDHEMNPDSMDITAILLKYKSKMTVLNMPRIINEQTNMQAVLPALEINRLFYMMGVGATTLKMIAGGIMVMAGFSVFFVLYSRLKERKYELALMRSVGYRPKHLFALLMLEGLLLAIIGYVLGWLLSRLGIYFISRQAESDFNMEFGSGWVAGEGWLLLLTILIGVISSLLPSWKAMKMDVAATLTESKT